jgi:hypothetical protein
MRAEKDLPQHLHLSQVVTVIYILFRLLLSPLLLFITGGKLLTEGRVHVFFGLLFLLIGVSWCIYVYSEVKGDL